MRAPKSSPSVLWNWKVIKMLAERGLWYISMEAIIQVLRWKLILFSCWEASQARRVFQCPPWKMPIKMGVIGIRKAWGFWCFFYWGVYNNHSPSLSIRLMDGVVNVLILKKHHLLNFSLPLVSSDLDKNLVPFIVGDKETQTNMFKM